MAVKESFEYEREKIYTVALYGTDEPVFFSGNLIFKKYYLIDGRKRFNQEKTTQYMVDTIFYETSRVLFTQKDEPYDAPRDLWIYPFRLLGDPFLIVYNRNASYGLHGNNDLIWMRDIDPDAHGLAILMKKGNSNVPELLTEREARYAERSLRQFSKYSKRG